jgi:DNA-directed RNA polymerase omega subunit
VSTESASDGTPANAEAASEPFGNRFLLVAVASRRVMQIRSGSPPRIDGGSHKQCFIAVAEVLAGCVTYFVAAKASDVE